MNFDIYLLNRLFYLFILSSAAGPSNIEEEQELNDENKEGSMSNKMHGQSGGNSSSIELTNNGGLEQSSKRKRIDKSGVLSFVYA